MSVRCDWCCCAKGAFELKGKLQKNICPNIIIFLQAAEVHPFVRAADDLLHHLNEIDAVLIFEDQSALDQGNNVTLMIEINRRAEQGGSLLHLEYLS